MPDEPLDDRRFTDAEVREILKKAVQEVEKATPSSRAVVKRDGLSLADIKAIGREVGIDASRLEDAARSVALGNLRKQRGILGGPVILNVERTVDGSLDPDRTHEVLSVIRRVMGQKGTTEEIGGALEWSTEGESGNRYVTIGESDGKTTIRGSVNLNSALVVAYFVPGLFGLMASIIGLAQFIKSGSLVGLIVALATLPILFPILRSLFNRGSDRASANLELVVDEVARLMESSDS